METGLKETAVLAMADRRIWWLLAVLLAVAVLVYAWIDGGEEPMRDIVVPVAVPGGVS